MRTTMAGCAVVMGLALAAGIAQSAEPTPMAWPPVSQQVGFVPVAGWGQMAPSGYPNVCPTPYPYPYYPQPQPPQAQPQAPRPAQPAPQQPGQPQQPQQPQQQQQQDQAAQQPSTDAFSQADAGGTESSGSYAPNMLGDFQGYSVKQVITVCPPSGPVQPISLPQLIALRELQNRGGNGGFSGISGNSGGGFAGNSGGGIGGSSGGLGTSGGGPGPYGGGSLGLFGNNVGYAYATLQTELAITPPPQPVCPTVTARVPIAARAGFKIAEDESPRPQRRVFFNYNYFNNVNGEVNQAPRRDPRDFGPVAPAIGAILNEAQNRVMTPGIGGMLMNTPPPVPQIDVHYQVIGAELPFLDNDVASIGIRIPVAEQVGAGELSSTDFGDITAILKYALYLDAGTGDVFSVGLGLTMPTGTAIPVSGSRIDSFLFQPYFGYIYTMSPFYVHGFSSLVVPTEGLDAVLLFNDVGFGWQYSRQGRFVSAIGPTIELHLTTPLTQRGALNEPLGVPDMLVSTAGLHTTFLERAVLTVGAAVPWTGPRPYDFEILAQMNYRF